MASPPKPWERAGAGSASAVSGPATTATATTTATSSSAAPSLPARPSTLSSVVNQQASNYSTVANRYGSSPYGYGSTMGGMGGMGGYGGYSSYSSPYSRFGGGGYGSMYGGGMGGGMYGGMGGGMYGGMGGMGGMGPNPNDPNSLTGSFTNSTQATFQLIENIVGAFGGFAQMLESTYMATHSSFFAMVSVAEQFGNLKQTLGSILGIFTLMRWFRTIVAKLTGRPPPASPKDLTPQNFAAFNGGKLPDGTVAQAKPSKKPFIMFIVAVFGLPWLMGKLIRALAASHEEAEKRRLAENPQLALEGQPLDPSKLDFCRVMYDFTPELNQNAVQGVDLAVKKGDLVAVLSKTDPLGNPSEWWRCRARDGRMGYLPSPYLETIQRRQQITSGSQAGSPTGSRAQTMTNSTIMNSAPSSRTATMTGVEAKDMAKPAPVIDGKPGDMGIESFQKGQFYS